MEIIPREAWLNFAPRSRAPATHRGNPAVVHWFGPGRAAEGRRAGIAQARSFARYHVYTLGWSDFAYNWCVLRDGTILEGRGRDVRGAHAGHNTANGYAGVMLLCGTETPAPTEAQIAALQWLAVREGWERFTKHSEWSATACPGPVLSPWVDSHRIPHSSPASSTRVYPHGTSLRVVVNGRTWAGDKDGWGKALDALRAVARRGLKPEARAVITWRGNRWDKYPGDFHGPIVNVARTLLNRYDGGWIA